MFAHGVELEGVDVDVAVHLLQEAARRAHFLDDEVAYAKDDGPVVCRQDLLERRRAERYGYQVECGFHAW